MEVDEFNIPRFLAVLPLFSDLSPLELSRAAQGCQVLRLARATSFSGSRALRRVPCRDFRASETVCHFPCGA